MAITPINNRYPGFIFDGENSRDYGVYITDVEVFGAPKRKVQMISIPGRNGDYALDEGSFENIPVKYKCVLGAGTEEDFNDGISDFRNWLASKVGYKVLSDEINLGEYRKAVFLEGMEVPTLNKKTGTFDIVFDCMPQRWLDDASALPVEMASGDTITNPTLFESNPLIALVGYGGVDFNGTPITVYNYTLGDIELTAAETHGFVDEQFRITNTATYTFETAFLNPGDPVYMQGGEFLFKFYTTSKVWVQSWSSDGFIGTPTVGTYITPSVPKNPTNAGNWTSNTFYIHANITNTISFVYGTATTINDAAALSVEYRDRDGITHTSNFDISFTATYNGGGTVAVSITATSVGSQCEENSYPYDNMHFAAFSTFSATSSYAPSDLFIDSDIGEAYFLQSGAVISANNYIYMNELPTLKPGANVIIYDNTITDFQVVPRWWKV